MTVDDKAPATAADHPDTAAVQARVAAAGGAGPGPAAGRRWLALTLVLVPALLVLVVHDVAYLLRAPLWTDETWVAASTRFSLLKLPQTTSSTPIGWSVLLRLVTVGGTQVVGIAAFGAVGLVQLARRAWRRLAETAVAAAGTAVLMTVIYEAFDARAVLPGLTYSPHFRYFYLPVSQGWPASITFLAARFDYMRGYFGLGPLWLAALLFAAGLVTIYRLGRPATAVTLAALWPEMLAVSALHKYPFLDERTSTFLFAVTVVTAAMGVVGVCCLLRPWLRGALAATVAVAAVEAFALGAQPYLRRHPIPAGHGDIRGQTQYIAAHAAPGDVILVNLSSNWGFAYYWPAGRPSIRPDHAVLQEYEAYFPDQPRIVVALGRDSAGVSAAVSRALARARAQPDACVRIWLVRTHVSPDELAAWRAALAQRGLDLTHVGDAGLSVVPAGGPCAGLALSPGLD